MELPTAYDPKKVEDKIYQLWLKSGFFNPDKLPKTHKKPFTIAVPPPNITGELHMGHALNATVQDILIRWKRMQGFKALWLPGTDHAGIAAQNVVEKQLKKENKTRFDLGREEFIKRIWVWQEKYGNIILEQFKKLGSSLDWSRTRFTMDQEYQKAVETAFLHYHKKGWIYRGKRVVNWCPRCQTSLSDLELEYLQEPGKLWHIKYPLKNEVEKYIIVATTRPETMLGDTAVAVNPKDKKYKNLVGKKAILPLTDREIPIISDELVDLNFGTGAVKVTPAHDLTDYQIGQKHNLESLQVINEKSRITDLAPEIYRGLKTLEARQKIVEDLQKLNLLEKTEDYQISLPKCYRCNTTVELILSDQWFLKMQELAQYAIKAVKKGNVKIRPKNFEKGYLGWLANIKDWCISRQIWWGHKIPLEGENDVLDTWFSSALWPFAILGWPEKTKGLKDFYPTQVLSTARDIINLWVARMIFSGLEFTNKYPFSDIFIHPTVLTKEGKRMSKSLGTGIDPLQLVEKYGADATRFGIIWHLMGGQDIRFVEDNILMGKKFCNKIWNASRFALLQVGDKPLEVNGKFKLNKLTKADKKILADLKKLTIATNKNLENFKFGPAGRQIYHFFWHNFCDLYIETSKKQMQDKNEETKKVLLYVLLSSLKLLHPFMPFLTEEIYQSLPQKNKKECLMIEAFPK